MWISFLLACLWIGVLPEAAAVRLQPVGVVQIQLVRTGDRDLAAELCLELLGHVQEVVEAGFFFFWPFWRVSIRSTRYHVVLYRVTTVSIRYRGGSGTG